MNDDFKDIREITYSREIYEAKPRVFVSAFIYIVLFIFIISLIWAYFSEIDIIARGSGVVRPNENISMVRVESAGKLERINVYEGKDVKKGEVLYVIDHKALDLQKEELEEKLSDLEQKLKSLNEYKAGIENAEVAFSASSKYADFYKTKYENYKSNLDYLKYQEESNKLNIAKSNQADDISIQLSSLRSDYSKMLSLEKSIKQGKNFTRDEFYSNKYQAYTDLISKQETDINYLSDRFDKISKLYEAGVVSKKEYEDVKYDLSKKQADLSNYKTSYMANLQEDINSTKKSISQFEVSLRGANITNKQLSNEKENSQTILEKFKLDNLLAASEEIEACKDSIDNYNLSLKDLNIKIDDTIIKAQKDGKVNIIRDVSVGEYIAPQTELITIIPENEAGYIVDIALANSFVAGVKAGDKAKFKFQALPFKEYGEFTGEISQISTDAKMDRMGNSYYGAKANLDDTIAISYKGEKRNIKVGMTCEVHIIKEQKKVLYWLLEKINLRD